jgi:vacuolar-type H+-ATPase subunit I/STV1
MIEEKFDNFLEEEAEGTQEETQEKTPAPKFGVDEPEKFKGKSRYDVIKSYQELEKKMRSGEHKAQEKAEEIRELEQGGGTKKEVREAKKDLEQIRKEIEEEIENADYSQMDARRYSKFLMDKVMKGAGQIIDQRAEEKARSVFFSESKYQDRIQKELTNAAKEYPILQENSEKGKMFKGLMIDIVSAARHRGEKIPTVIEAAEKASKIMGIEKPTPKPKPIEKTQPQTLGRNRTQDEIVKQGMLNRNNSPLKGL